MTGSISANDITKLSPPVLSYEVWEQILHTFTPGELLSIQLVSKDFFLISSMEPLWKPKFEWLSLGRVFYVKPSEYESSPFQTAQNIALNRLISQREDKVKKENKANKKILLNDRLNILRERLEDLKKLKIKRKTEANEEKFLEERIPELEDRLSEKSLKARLTELKEQIALKKAEGHNITHWEEQLAELKEQLAELKERHVKRKAKRLAKFQKKSRKMAIKWIRAEHNEFDYKFKTINIMRHLFKSQKKCSINVTIDQAIDAIWKDKITHILFKKKNIHASAKFISDCQQAESASILLKNLLDFFEKNMYTPTLLAKWKKRDFVNLPITSSNLKRISVFIKENRQAIYDARVRNSMSIAGF